MSSPHRISVVLDCSDPDRLVPFWQEALGYPIVESLDGYRVLVPGEGASGPVLILQPVPEPRAGKNRMHIDIHSDDAPRFIELLQGLGGQILGDRVDAHGIWWQTMQDPEGNEFCVVADAGAPTSN